MPFLPGGLDDAIAADEEATANAKVLPSKGTTQASYEGFYTNSNLQSKGFRTVPPGFSRGLRLPGEEADPIESFTDDYPSPTDVEQEDDVAVSILRFISRVG